jgi:hypothetical protein
MRTETFAEAVGLTPPLWSDDQVITVRTQCMDILAELLDEPVGIFNHLTGAKLSRRDRWKLAALTLLECRGHHGAHLVHGWAWHELTPWEPIRHAWCEFPDVPFWSDGVEELLTVCVDFTQIAANVLPAPVYYSRVLIEKPLYRYTYEEMLMWARRTKSDGPWQI